MKIGQCDARMSKTFHNGYSNMKGNFISFERDYRIFCKRLFMRARHEQIFTLRSTLSLLRIMYIMLNYR